MWISLITLITVSVCITYKTSNLVTNQLVNKPVNTLLDNILFNNRVFALLNIPKIYIVVHDINDIEEVCCKLYCRNLKIDYKFQWHVIDIINNISRFDKNDSITRESCITIVKSFDVNITCSIYTIDNRLLANTTSSILVQHLVTNFSVKWIKNDQNINQTSVIITWKNITEMNINNYALCISRYCFNVSDYLMISYVNNMYKIVYSFNNKDNLNYINVVLIDNLIRKVIARADSYLTLI